MGVSEVVPIDRRSALEHRSRRTVFDCFATLDDVATAVCSDLLGGLVDTVTITEVARALRTTELVGPMAYLTRALGGPDRHVDIGSPWAAVLDYHWLAATGAADDEASRAVWDDYIERLLAAVGNGYGAAPGP